MHKLFSRTCMILTACSIALAIPSTAQATVSVYQHQSSSSSIEIECSGDCSAKSESSQSQTQRVGEPVWHSSNHHNPRSNWRTHQPTHGQATITWPQRGGTCTIRYTESSARWYKYTTTTSCDTGELTIGGLVPGGYKFQVRQDNGNWGQPVWLVAW